MLTNKILQGDNLDILKTLPNESVDCIITSPPYWGLRDYGMEDQLGLEPTLELYLKNMLKVTRELRRILKKGGTLWWNHGDSYGGTNSKGAYVDPKYKGRTGQAESVSSGFKEKSLLMQPHRLALRMTDEQGWILRNIIIWHKPNAMPASVKDRFTVDFEEVFFFVKNKTYFFNQLFDDIKSVDDRRVGQERSEYNGKFAGHDNAKAFNSPRARTQKAFVTINPEGKNKRSMWSIPTKPFADAHFATFPESLIEPMILAGCPRGGVILDPFFGAGTTGVVAKKLGMQWLGIELNPDYIKIAQERVDSTTPPLF